MTDSTVVSLGGKALGMLRDLAAHLGTTLEYLWPRYTAYVAAQAVSHMVVWGVLVAIAITGINLGFMWVKNTKNKEHRSYGDDEGPYTVVAISSVLTAVGLIFFCFSLSNGIAALCAPEGYALAKLMSQLK